MGKIICGTIVLAVLVLLSPPVAAQQGFVCVDTDDDMQEQMAQHNELLQFVGVNKLGQIFFVYAGQATFTVWFVRSDGAICTGPMYLGDVLKTGHPA
jgi:hypothetical protein